MEPKVKKNVKKTTKSTPNKAWTEDPTTIIETQHSTTIGIETSIPTAFAVQLLPVP